MLRVCLWVLGTSESWKTENTWEIAATFWRNFLNNCWPANVTHCARGEMIGNSCAAEWIAKQILVEWRRYCYCTRVNNTVFVRRHRLDCWKDSVLSTVRRQGCHFDHTYASAPDNRHEEYFIARWAQSLKTLVWDLINMQNVLNHVSDRSSHLTGKQQIFFTIWSIVPSVLWRCWLGGRKGIRPVKNEWWGADVVICLERGADLHMPSWCHCHPLSLASVKSRLVLPFWYWPTRVVLKKGPLNGCVCVCVGPLQLSCHPKLQCHSWRICLLYVCLSKCW